MKDVFAKSIFASALIAMLLPLAGSSYDAIDKPYDWTVEITTEKLTRQFEYEGSLLTPVCKTRIRYFAVANEDEKRDYEDMWFHDGKALGLERKDKFDVTEGEGVAIKVKHKTPTPTSEEFEAAANAVSRIYLDAYLNKNPIVTVIVQDEVYHDMSGKLQDENWQVLPESPDVALDAQVNLHLQSESGDLQETLTYQHP